MPPFKNAANTNIIGYANRLLALFEAGSPHELKPLTLETVGLFDFGGKLTGPVTAHPKFDPATATCCSSATSRFRRTRRGIAPVATASSSSRGPSTPGCR